MPIPPVLMLLGAAAIGYGYVSSAVRVTFKARGAEGVLPPQAKDLLPGVDFSKLFLGAFDIEARRRPHEKVTVLATGKDQEAATKGAKKFAAMWAAGAADLLQYEDGDGDLQVVVPIGMEKRA